MASASSRAPYPMPVLPTCPECGRDSAGPPPSLGKRIVVALVLVMLLLGSVAAWISVHPTIRAIAWGTLEPMYLPEKYTLRDLEDLTRARDKPGSRAQ